MKGTNIRPRHGGNKDNFGRGFPWILCDLMPHGKRVVRGSPDNAKAFWTFCPLKKFPRDKVKISKCEECPHFQGYRKSFSNKVAKSLSEFGDLTRTFQRRTNVSGIRGIKGQKQGQTQQPQGTKYGKLNIKKGKPQPKRPRITLTDKNFKEAIKRKEEEDRKFWEEEERLQKKNKESDKKK